MLLLLVFAFNFLWFWLAGWMTVCCCCCTAFWTVNVYTLCMWWLVQDQISHILCEISFVVLLLLYVCLLACLYDCLLIYFSLFFVLLLLLRSSRCLSLFFTTLCTLIVVYNIYKDIYIYVYVYTHWTAWQLFVWFFLLFNTKWNCTATLYFCYANTIQLTCKIHNKTNIHHISLSAMLNSSNRICVVLDCVHTLSSSRKWNTKRENNSDKSQKYIQKITHIQHKNQQHTIFSSFNKK